MAKVLSITLLSLLATGCVTNSMSKKTSSSATVKSANNNVTTAKPVKRMKIAIVKSKDSKIIADKLFNQEKRWRGTPYRLGGNSLQGIDCSAFVQRTFTDRFAVNLPRTTSAQTTQGIPVPRDNLKPGDLVFFKTNWGENGLHVGIYSGDGQFIHASSSKGVMSSSLDNIYWKKHFYQARRVQLFTQNLMASN